MLLNEFDYYLPESQIAQLPASTRDQARLLVLQRGKEESKHLQFSLFPSLLKKGDVLVVNDTRVIPARLRGKKQTGGVIEILLDRPLEPCWKESGCYCQRWSCLLHSSRPLRTGVKVTLDRGGELIGDGCVSESREPRVLLRLPEPIDEYLDRHGEVPLPAYIRRGEQNGGLNDMDRKRYQCVYAKEPGAIAAPTAGLHFTEHLLDQIKQLGVKVAPITLHVGPGTFLPVRCDVIEEHQMHFERFSINETTARMVTEAHAHGERVVAVGTTVVRCLESAWKDGVLTHGSGETDLYIRPGYDFKVTDALLTNFHLPRSTLLMLVCAFGGMQKVLAAYREAVELNYRFFSYGDAMFLA